MDTQSLTRIIKFVAYVGLAFSLFLLFPLAVGIWYDEAYLPFLIFSLLFFLVNFLLFASTRRHAFSLSLKEGILSVNIVWILLGIGGMLPLLLYTDATVPQAFFEAVSGFTTTGATVFGDVESLPKTVLAFRSTMHWVGGMGIIVLGVGLFPLINPNGSLTMFRAEATGIKMEKLTPKIADTAVRLWGIYVALTLTDALLLWLEGMTPFDAINHAMSTVSTGGFSTKNASFGFYSDNSWILWTTTLFMLIGGINFLAHLKWLHGERSGYRCEEVRWYLRMFIFLSAALGYYLFFYEDTAAFSALTHAAFNVASLMTTTGFATVDYDGWRHDAVALIIIAMMVSGNAGSTAGGIKVIRWVIMFRALIREVKQTFHPEALMPLVVDRTVFQNRVLFSTFGVVALFALTTLAAALYLYGSGYDALTSFSTALACAGNIGPGLGLTGPTQNYGFFSGTDLMLLSGVMIAGRLEFVTILLLLSRSFWKRF